MNFIDKTKIKAIIICFITGIFGIFYGFGVKIAIGVIGIILITMAYGMAFFLNLLIDKTIYKDNDLSKLDRAM